MALSERERFTRCAFGQDLDLLPIQCDFSGSGLKHFLAQKGIGRVSDLELLPFFPNHVLYAYMNGAVLKMKTKDFAPEEKIVTDEWGCDWDTSQDLFYCSHPLKDWADFENYEFPDPWAPGYLDYARELAEGYGKTHIVTSYHFCCLFERAYILRGFENVLMDFCQEEELVSCLLDKITDFHVELAKRYISLGVNCGRTVDDYGSQNGMIMSPDMWRTFIKPRLARIHDVYRNAGLPIIHHSCGHITPIIEDLIEIGVNVLNPVQPNVMDLQELSDRFGSRISFFGGICNQHVLPYCTPEEIDSNVQETTRILGKHGRFIISPSNGVGMDVPMENVEAYFQAAKKYRKL